MNQGVEAVAGHFRQGFKIGEGHVAVGVPLHLVGQKICHIPVVGGGGSQLGDGVIPLLHADILGNGTGVVVQTENQGVQQVHKAHHRQHPSDPADGTAAEHNHQNYDQDGGNGGGQYHHLPQAEGQRCRPGSQNVHQGPGQIGVDHVHQIGEPLSQLQQGPGYGADDGGGQISSPVFQRKRLLEFVHKRL